MNSKTINTIGIAGSTMGTMIWPSDLLTASGESGRLASSSISPIVYTWPDPVPLSREIERKIYLTELKARMNEVMRKQLCGDVLELWDEMWDEEYKKLDK